jgi:hypothetical protein
MEILVLILVVGTSIWVAVDANAIGVKKSVESRHVLRLFLLQHNPGRVLILHRRG